MKNSNAVKIFPVCMTAVCTLFIGWAIYQLCLLGDHPGDLKASGAKSRAEKAKFYLKKIARAQEKYIKMDPDGDGINSYCRFMPHLWQSVRWQDSEPIRLNLVCKELAFATEKDFALYGYEYKFLRSREKKGSKEGIVMDYSKEWAALTRPVMAKFVDTGKYGLAGEFAYILTSDGKIFRKKASTEETKLLPEKLPNNDWSELNHE